MNEREPYRYDRQRGERKSYVYGMKGISWHESLIYSRDFHNTLSSFDEKH